MKTNRFTIAIVALYLSACGGGSSEAPTSPAPVSVIKTTQITSLSLDTELVREQVSNVVIECDDCLREEATYRWEIGGVVVSDSASFTPNFEHLDKTVSITAQVPSIDNVLSDAVTISEDIVSRKTTIQNLRFDSTFIREHTTTVLFECDDCINEEAQYSWTIDGNEVNDTEGFTPDFEHLDKTISVTVRVPSVDRIITEPDVIEDDIISRKTQVDALVFSTSHMPNQVSTAALDCVDCLPETLAMQWFIDGELVSSDTSFTPNSDNFEEQVSIRAQVTSVDLIVSEVFTEDYVKPVPVSGYTTTSELFVLMSNGELIFKGSSQSDGPEDDQKDFVSVFYERYVWGTLLAEDSQGNYYKFGDDNGLSYTEFGNKFDDIRNLLNSIQDYWVDSYGEHVLTNDGTIITWGNRPEPLANFDFSDAQLAQNELTNVEQVIHSLYDCNSSDSTSAVLYKSGRLVIDGFWGDQYEYTQYEKQDVTKIQAVSYSSTEGYDAVAIFDKDDNVEVWTCSNDAFFYTQANGTYARGYGDLTNVERIVSPAGSQAILAIKHDASYAMFGSGLLYRITSLDPDIKVQGLLRISWLLVLIDEDGNVHYLDDYWANYFPDKYPEFTFDDLDYSVRSDHANGVVVKKDGSALLITQDNPRKLDAVKSVNLVPNFMLIIDDEDTMTTYWGSDSERPMDADYFSNNMNQIDHVQEIKKAGTGFIVRTKLGEFIMIHPYDRNIDSYHSKLNRPLELIN
ncbi:hypothetical protein [Paraglaciecola arctica]|uniref:hypothetical protein n=1 Tax=Paraglaciecola arctica TaxID=1128911 RepID=UPI001C079764|nr:hypothetical protein [Paraglaciecola arctica]MBU3006217.1 hypothetical protein [Paraglaciecola arctica]